MRKLPFALLVVCLFALGGCAKKVDVEGAKTALGAADAAWSQAATNVDSFLEFFLPDGAVYPPNEPAAVGSDAVRSWANSMMSMPGFQVTWQATTVEVAASGDVGYTAGTYSLQMNMGGTPITDTGKYLTVWKKNETGAWKVAVDVFNSDLPVMAAPAPADTTVTPAQ
jgi:ketosteroid isomerase-like protein